MEGSKAFSKDFMKKHNIPTAAYEVKLMQDQKCDWVVFIQSIRISLIMKRLKSMLNLLITKLY